MNFGASELDDPRTELISDPVEFESIGCTESKQMLAVVVTPRSEGLKATCTIRGVDEAERCRK